MNDKTPRIPDDRQVSVKQVDKAFSYLGEQVFCIGRCHKTRKFISERLKYRLPPLPLLLSNKELRESLESRRKSPLFRIVAASIATKAKNLKEEIKAAQNFSPRQDCPVLYRLEPPKDGEESYLPLTWEEYQVMVKDGEA